MTDKQGFGLYGHNKDNDDEDGLMFDSSKLLKRPSEELSEQTEKAEDNLNALKGFGGGDM